MTTTNYSTIQDGDRITLSNGKAVRIVNVGDLFDDDGRLMRCALVENVQPRTGVRYWANLLVGYADFGARLTCTHCGMVATADPQLHAERYAHTPTVAYNGAEYRWDGDLAAFVPDARPRPIVTHDGTRPASVSHGVIVCQNRRP